MDPISDGTRQIINLSPIHHLADACHLEQSLVTSCTCFAQTDQVALHALPAVARCERMHKCQTLPHNTNARCGRPPRYSEARRCLMFWVTPKLWLPLGGGHSRDDRLCATISCCLVFTNRSPPPLQGLSVRSCFFLGVDMIALLEPEQCRDTHDGKTTSLT